MTPVTPPVWPAGIDYNEWGQAVQDAMFDAGMRIRVRKDAAAVLDAIAPLIAKAVEEAQWLSPLGPAGDDLWNELENCRGYWEERPDANLIQEYIDTWERLQARSVAAHETRKARKATA